MHCAIYIHTPRAVSAYNTTAEAEKSRAAKQSERPREMASKAFPALVLLALVCGQLVVGGHAQPYTGGGHIRGGGGSAAGLQPPTYTATHGHSSTIGGYDGTGRPSAVEEEKAFMVNSLPAHNRPLPVPPSGH